ncbi:MAG TPA: histidine kinase [Saprospiraceae bacterium]|nr:histidine kinase [Saprospiraceae bacterium]
MAGLLNRNHLFRLMQVFQKPWLLHALFWLLVFFVMLMAGPTNTSSLLEITRKLINLAFYILVVYINLGYLIPRFLSQKNFMTYCLLLLVMVAVFTPILVTLLYLTTEEAEPREYLLMNQQWIFLLLFMIAGGSTVIKIISDWQRHQRDRKDLETQRMQSEIKFLKSQINPHFLFNTLNSLYALTLKKSDKAPEIVIKLSEMMRYMLYECNERRVPLQKEVNYIENYLAMEKLRQSGRADILFKVEGQISDQTIAPLIFIPFLENSFKHGLNHQINDGYVHVNMKVLGEKLLLRILNSKPNQAIIPLESQNGGIGLANVRRRLSLLYPNQYKLDIEESEKEHIVELSLDLSN